MANSQGVPVQKLSKMKELHSLKCTVRDGTIISTDAYMPTEGGPFPALLIRTPYDLSLIHI